MEKYDVIIIGGGVVGALTARACSRYQLRTLLIEKESDVGMGTSSANSAFVHAGYDPIPGTLKASTNVAGNAMWDTLSAELGVSFDRRGDYVVALSEEELPHLEMLLEQGKKNGVPGLCVVTGDEMRHRQPLLNPEVKGALWAPTGGICDPFAITVAAAENAIQNGVDVLLETAFQDFIMEGRKITGIRTNQGEFHTRWVVNAAGLYADNVMHKACVRPEFEIKPRRGEYYILDRAEFPFEDLYFPVPSSKGKGTVVAATVHGNVIIGPNAQIIEDREDKSVTSSGLDEVWGGAKRLVPSLTFRPVIAVFAGLRAHGNAPCLTPGVDYDHDFIIDIPNEVKGLVNLGGIESPGLTAAPAIAERVIELLKDAGEKLVDKPGWNPIRPSRPRFRDLDLKGQAALIKKDPRYARVACRCEMVTEGEIIAEIHSPLPARNYDAIKRRTWLGTGRCLGSFDMPRVVEILARELGISALEVTKKGHGSAFLTGHTKSDTGGRFK